MLRLIAIRQLFMEKGLTASVLSLFKEKRIFFLLLHSYICFNICVLLGNFFFKNEASATSFLNPEIRLVSGSADYNKDVKWSWLSRSDWPSFMNRNYVYRQESTTMIFAETDQNSTWAQICDNRTGQWEQYDYEWTGYSCVYRDILSGSLPQYMSCRNEGKDITLYDGAVTENYGIYPCDSKVWCKYHYSNCGLDLQERLGETWTISGNSSTVLQINCQGSNANGTLNVTTFVNIKNENNAPQKTDVYLNGYLPTTPWMSTQYDSYRKVHEAWATMNWAIPINQPCGSTVALTPSAIGFAEVNIITIGFQSSCNLQISNFSSNRTIIDPSIGVNVNFSGTMTAAGQNINWTMTLKDSSGATWRTFGGNENNPSITWDGKDSFGRIVNDGLYTATLEAQTQNGQCQRTATAQVRVKSSCGDIGISATPDSVRPAQTGQETLTKATVGIVLSKPAPASGCEIRLRVEGVEGSGGHDHIGGRNSHTGTLSSNFVLFVERETSTSVEYTSGVVGGTEKIIAELMDQNGNVMSTRSISVDIKVADLQFFSGGSPYYQLAGSTIAHSSNHFGLASTVDSMGHVADDYYISTGALLGINDMSLEWGGLFDIAGNWSPPHRSHRKGTSVDINRCAASAIPNNPNARTCVTSYDEQGNPVWHTCDPGTVCVERDVIQRICRRNGNARMVQEATHHCEFPQ